MIGALVWSFALSPIVSRAQSVTRLYRIGFVNLAAANRIPAAYEFVRALGLSVPQPMLMRADEVIQ